MEGENLVAVASFATVEDAEEAGAALIEQGITVRLDGGHRVDGSATLFVKQEDAARAQGLLDLQRQVKEERDPFHPCPRCEAEDPMWFGKRRLIGFGVVIAILIVLGATKVSAPIMLLATFLGFLAAGIVAQRIPQFECRRCHHRWSETPKHQAR